MYTDIKDVEGIGDVYKEKLKYVGVTTVTEFLALAMTAEKREKLSHDSGIPIGHIENWTSMIDLTRVDGIGFQYAELLTYSGVKSVDDLRKRNSSNLYDAVTKTNERHFSGIVPSVQMIDGFIANSKKLTHLVELYK